MTTAKLFDCLTKCDQLTAEEIKDLAYVQDRIEVHLENHGYDSADYDVEALAKELSSAMLN